MFRQVQRHVLPDPVGPVTDHSVGPADRVEQQLLLVGLVTSRVDAEPRRRRIEDPHHDLLAEQRRQRRDAKSMARWLDSTIFIRPSCGTRFSEMSSREMTLIRDASFP